MSQAYPREVPSSCITHKATHLEWGRTLREVGWKRKKQPNMLEEYSKWENPKKQQYEMDSLKGQLWLLHC